MNMQVLRGVLIILVIVDHNEFSRSLFPGFLKGMSFHVAAFMTIPFLKSAMPFWSREFGNYLARLYYPFFLLTCLLGLAVAVNTGAPSFGHLGQLGLALYSGNAMLLKAVTHMALLWFLPSFIALVALRSAIEQAGTSVRSAAIAAACLVHPLVGTYAVAIQNYLPLGLLPALYMLPLAYATVVLQRRVLHGLPAAVALVLAVGAFGALKLLQMSLHLSNEIGFALVADGANWRALLINDLEAVSGTLMLFQVARFNLGALIAQCGKYSLQIYLFHAFVALAVFKLLLTLAPNAGALVLFALSMLLTVVLSAGLSRTVLEHHLARRFIFPRSYRHWLGLEQDDGQAPLSKAA